MHLLRKVWQVDNLKIPIKFLQLPNTYEANCK
jgi:hypothetical protein